MRRSSADIIPVEIWEQILSYATASSLLPFTENGKIASSLIDTIDLFSTDCIGLRAYIDDTQSTVERLRLVCRSWAKLLQRIVNEVALTNLRTYYFPSNRPVEWATYLWIGGMSDCACWWTTNKRSARCVHLSLRDRKAIQEKKDLDQTSLLRFFSPQLKILFWSHFTAQRLDLPLSKIGNLMALSISSSNMPVRLSLKDLSVSLPHLSHLDFPINEDNANILFEEVELRALSYFSLKLTLWRSHEQPIMASWTFPQLRTLLIEMGLSIEQRADFERFLYNHRNSIVELDPSWSYYKDNNTDLSVVSPSLWNICPNIKILGTNTWIISQINESPEGAWETMDTPIPPLTFLMSSPSISWEEELDNLSAISKRLNVEKVVNKVPWSERHQTEMSLSKVKAFIKTEGPKLHAKRLLQMVDKTEISIVDKYGSPLSAFLTHLIELE
jgi:hypothetical protein